MAEQDVEVLRKARESFARKRRAMAEQMVPAGAACADQDVFRAEHTGLQLAFFRASTTAAREGWITVKTVSPLLSVIWTLQLAVTWSGIR